MADEVGFITAGVLQGVGQDRQADKGPLVENSSGQLNHNAVIHGPPHPHFPKVEGVYYLQKAPKAASNGKLDKWIDRFCPKTPRDRELIKALILPLSG